MSSFVPKKPSPDFSAMAFAGFLIQAPGINEKMRNALAGAFSGLAGKVAAAFNVESHVASVRILDLMNNAHEVVQRFGFTVTLTQMETELRAIDTDQQVSNLSEYEKLMLQLLALSNQSLEVANGLFDFNA